MKLYLIIFILLTSLSSLSQTNDKIFIYPNQGIDNIELFKSKPADVEKFKGTIYCKSIYLTIRCGNSGGKRAKFTTYFNDSTGIYFVFRQREKSRILPIWTKIKLSYIEITKAINSSDNIVVGKSSKEDVLNYYGPLPKDWNHDSYIYFNDKGIGFEFNEENIVTKIKIFRI